jgi:transposase InsO family protein
VKFAFIKAKTGQFPVAWMCRRLGVSRSGYYGWQNRKPSEHARRDEELRLKVKAMFDKFESRYGSPRLTDELRESGEKVSRKRVIRLMQEQDLSAVVPKKFKKTTDSKHDLPVAENLVARHFNPDAPNKVWAADISYVRTWQGWLYLAVVLDLFSRRVVGWAMADHMRTELPLEALQMALRDRCIEPGLIHHSDRGSQYASNDYQKALANSGMICSMSRKGDCWDNSVVESFFATLKKELIYRHSWPTRACTKEAIDEYIGTFYNCVRRHSAAGNMCPMAYEMVAMRDQLALAA